MTQDLQQLLEKIQRDGVDKAQEEADKLLDGARAQAKAIIETAHAEAAKVKASTRQEAESFETRAEETIRQAARDTVLSVEKAVTRLLERLLLKDVNAELGGNGALVGELAAEAVRTYLSGKDGIEVATSEKLVGALRARLASLAASGVTVVTDDTTSSGFRISIDKGRVEHAFTGAAVADTLAKNLRPRLAALMKP